MYMRKRGERERERERENVFCILFYIVYKDIRYYLCSFFVFFIIFFNFFVVVTNL